MAVALLESWGILGNIVFKLLYKLRPALTHRPTIHWLSLQCWDSFVTVSYCFWSLRQRLNYERYHRDEGSGGREESTPGRGGGGVLLGILGGGVPPGSSNPDPISDQKMWFSSLVFTLDLYKPYPFSDLAFRQKLCYHYLIRLGRKHKLFKSIWNSHISLSFLLIWDWNDKNVYTLHPSKTQPASRTTWAKCIPVFRPKRRKSPTRWGGTYLYRLCKGVPSPGVGFCTLC